MSIAAISRYCCLMMVGALCAYAQSGLAELFGTIFDPAGLPAAGVKIELQNTATTARYRRTTTASGEYHFFGLQPGVYRVSVENNGFSTIRRSGVQLRVADRVTLDLTLAVGHVSEIIEVVAAPQLLQSNTGSVTAVVDQKRVVTLPLDGRNFVPLIALLPGVMLPPGQVLPRINGSRPRVSEYLYDGISVLQPEPGQVAYYPNIDAIAEFRVQVNSYSAEYGRSNGGVIQVQSKSGTNDWHGTLFEFFRNEALNARNLFAATGPKPTFRRNQYGLVLGGPVQKDRTFFFVDWQETKLRTGVTRFSTVPTTAERQGIFTMPVYDAATTERTSDGGYLRTRFSNNTIPASRFDRVGIGVLSRYPLPNVFTAAGSEATANNFRRSGADTSDADQFGIRLDRYLGQRHRLFGRYSFLRDDSSPTTPLPDGSGEITTGITGSRLTRADSVAVEHTFTRSPLSLNQFRFGYTRRGFDQSAMRGTSSNLRFTGLPESAFSNVPPTFQLTGFQQIGPPNSANGRFVTSVTQVLDTYSAVKGRHSIKLGADIRLQRLDVWQPPNPSGVFQFSPVLTSGLAVSGASLPNTGSSVASLLLGQVQSFSIDVQESVLKPRATIAEFFVQDDWKATSRLTLNVGVRHTLNFPSTEAENRIAVFNLDTQKLDYAGKNGFPRSARRLEKGNFGPRLGVAYQAAETFVLRAGYGLVWIEQAGITTPFTAPLFPFIHTAAQPSLDNLTPAFVLAEGPSVESQSPSSDSGLGQGVFGVQRDNGSGYAQQWNFTLQKTFHSDWSAEVGYLGSKLTRLGVPDTNLNQLRVEDLALGTQLIDTVPNPFYGQIPASSSLGRPTIPRQQLLRPYPRFSTVTLYRNNVGHSTYHAFQSHLQKRFSQGLTFSLAYTFSKLIDDAGAVFDSAVLSGPVTSYQSADSHNRRLEKDESTGSIPHVFSSGFVYELPFGRGRSHGLSGWRNVFLGGWQVAGIVRAQSGFPIAVTQATNLNAFAGFGVQRPNRLRDPNLPADERTTSRYFDTAAFTQARQFTIGNSSRNPVRGPRYRTADVMVGKMFGITERVGTEFRAEAFNLTNTPSLGSPNGSFGSGAFGTITTAFDPRVFEMVLKISF